MVQSYTALNGQNYTIWHSDLFYLFSKNSSTDVNIARRARSLGDLFNYIEHQNRVVVVAPNGKHYAIRKYNTVYKINRNNGTILDNDFDSFDAAKQMLDTCAVTTPVAYMYHAMCGFDTYGHR